jgi:hypothetical protein
MMHDASEYTSISYRHRNCSAVRTTRTTVEMYVHVSSAVVRYQYYCTTRVLVTTTVERIHGKVSSARVCHPTRVYVTNAEGRTV